jgi:DNA invertase Pin-like site-specific DNA recombinase
MTQKVAFYARTFATESMRIGYARVSTQDQHMDLQLKALKKAGCQKIFREKVSGASRNRPEFQRMLDQIRSGDTVIVLETRPAGPLDS